MAVTDLLRLLVVPVFAWTAVRDIKTRRISSHVWIPLSLVAVLLLVWDGWMAYTDGGTAWTNEFLLPVGVSIGFVVPMAYLFWWFGGFGGADAKALMVLAVLFPIYPVYTISSWTLPLYQPPVGAFAFTILTNAVLIGIIIPLLLAIRNGLAGRITPVMFIGWPIACDRIPETHGRLLETPNGMTLRGLDLDALRMYLRWRGIELQDIRDDADTYRNPDSLPAYPNPPTDGATISESLLTDGGVEPTDSPTDDQWGAETFLSTIESSAYGTTPQQLRDGLDVITDQDVVWVSPGTPFLVPTFLGLLIALTYGDLLVGTLL